MNSSGLKLNRYLGIIYWTVTLLIFAFVSNNDEKIIGELLIFYIPGTKWLVHLVFFVVIFFIYSILKFRWVIDSIEVLLLTKTLVDIISSCIINNPDSIAFIIWADIAVLAYLFCRNTKIDLCIILDIYELFALVLSIQTIIVGILLLQKGISFESVIFKSQLRIPYAGSNLIADVISSAFLCAVFRNESKKKITVLPYLKIAIFIVATLFIRSRGSIILLLLVFDWVTLKKIGTVKKKTNRIILLVLFIFANIIVIMYMLNSKIVESYFSRYMEASSDITSGRMDIWKYAWEEFINHPIMGRGISFDSDVIEVYRGAHNIWLDTLMSSGIVGIILHVMIIVRIIKTIRKKIKLGLTLNKSKIACCLVLSFLYINSLLEVSYYNYINDLIFWSLCGFLISELTKETKTIIFERI